MLIGQALAVSSGATAANGITLSSTLDTTVNNLAYTTGSYAPTSNGLTSEENAYYTVSIDSETVTGTPYEWEEIFEGATEINKAAGASALYAVSTSSDEAMSDVVVKTPDAVSSWYGAYGSGSNGSDTLDYTGNVSLLVETEGATSTLFGVVNAKKITGDVVIVMNSPGATVGAFSTDAGAITGAFRGAIDGKLTAVWEAGTTEKDIIGGFFRADAGDFIGEVELAINGGSIGGSVYGGSKSSSASYLTDALIKGDTKVSIAGGTIGDSVYGGGTGGTIGGSTHVDISGGTINGSVYGGGTGGTIDGSTNVDISGGVIKGNVYGNNATDLLSGNVTVESNRANIRGNIYADHVTLKDVAEGGKEYGFGYYANTISANKLSLDNVTVKTFGATLENVNELEAVQGTNTTLNMGGQASLSTITLNNSSVILKGGDTLTKVSTGQLDITGESTLGASLTLAPQASVQLNGGLSLAGGELSLGTLSLTGTSWENWLENGGSLTLFSSVSTLNLLDAEGAVERSFAAATGYTFTDEEVAALLGEDVDTESYTLKYAKGTLTLLDKSAPDPDPEPNPDPDPVLPTLAGAAVSHNAAAGAALLTGALESGVPGNGDLAPALLTALALLDSGNTAALNELMASMAGSSIATMGAAFHADIDRQLRAIRNRTTTMGIDPRQAYDDVPYFNAWVNAEGDYRKLEQDGTAAGYTLDSWGGTLGFDVDLTPQLVAGMAVTAMYGNLDASGADRAEGDLDTYYLTLFARYVSRAWTHTFVATAGWADAELDRTVSYAGGGYKTHGSTTGFGFGLMYELGYVIALNEESSTCLQPVFNVAWRHTSLNSFTETGSDAALYAGEQSMDAVTFGLGARFQSAVAENIYNRTALFEMRALLKADVGDRRNHLDVAMAYGDRRADIESAALGAVGVELGAGLTVPVGAEGGALFLDASADLREGYTNLNATVGYRITF